MRSGWAGRDLDTLMMIIIMMVEITCLRVLSFLGERKKRIEGIWLESSLFS